MAIELSIPASDEAIRALHVGDSVMLTGVMITGRDAVHKWLVDNFINPSRSPWVDDQTVYEAIKPILDGGMIYHCGPVVGGLDSLRRLADELYGERNPADVFAKERTHWIEPDGNSGYYLMVALPFVEKSDLDLYRAADELTLRVGPYRRNIVLPYSLWDLEISDAKFEQSTLNIEFKRDR